MTLLGAQSVKPESDPNPKESSDSNQSCNGNGNGSGNDGKGDERWGYDLYPERKGTKYKPSWTKTLMGIEGKEEIDKMKCERNVYSCITNSELLLLILEYSQIHNNSDAVTNFFFILPSRSRRQAHDGRSQRLWMVTYEI